MIFFGIPHKGFVVEDIQQMLAGDGKHPCEKLLQQIFNKSGNTIYRTRTNPDGSGLHELIKILAD